ncbi:MAG: GtrA family protein [Ottowia sp.]|nr:GtrA family protein [Ottowia sp.]
MESSEILTEEASAMLDIFVSRQFARFLLFGGISALVTIACGYVLYSTGALPYTLAVFVGAVSSIIVNFLLNYWFNFNYRGRKALSQFNTFFAVAGMGTLLTAGLAKLFLSALHALDRYAFGIGNHAISSEFVAQVLAVGLVTLYSYAAHKYLSFNEGICAAFRRIYVLMTKKRGLK